MLKFYFSTLGRGRLLPPEQKRFGGPGDFKATGEEFRRYFVDYGGLQPQHKVLDVGCGGGRMALPLTNYLSRQGQYCGFDLGKPGIQWCQTSISPIYKNFRFDFADIYSQQFNPDGQCPASEFRFPYEDNAFDFIYLTSVFTHMLTAGMENYVSEISRVAKPGAKVVITFFLINEESEQLAAQGLSKFDFKHCVDKAFVINANHPEQAVAYREQVVLELYSRYGLTMLEPIHYGNWCGRNKYLSFQDFTVAVKI